MVCTFGRNGIGTIAGSAVALSLVFQASLVATKENVPANNSGKVDLETTTTQHFVDGSNDGSYLPVVKVRAEYPKRAIERGIEGSVTVEFTVTETGAVEDPVVIESNPPGIFDRAATDTVSLYKYRPKIVDEEAVRTEGVKNKIVFEIDN
jgi:TonB family protein